VRLKDRIGDDNNNGPSASSPRNKPATDTDSLSGLQWDMRQIHAPEAHQITGGNHSVLVADIDTGMDFKHPDLKPNIDFENSASCIGGKPDQSPAAWNDDNGHGTHTAGTIAAASNGLGIVGVAPNVRIAAIKAGDSNGFFFPEAVVCAFMWAGTHDVNVTNNSYFADPFYYNCPSDPVEKAILTAESRAIRFAQNHGVAVVAAEGNFADDLAHPTVDIQSPDNATPVIRPVDRSCKIVPTTIPGVIVVSADGNLRQKSFYSSYGRGITDVTAPGGDSILQRTPDAPNGRVLSTFPPNPTLVEANRCSRTKTLPSGDLAEPVAFYCFLQGTSMAAPHVAGMAALILSRFGTPRGSDDENDDRTARLRALIDRAADPIACPSAAVLAGYAFFPQVDSLPLLVNGSGSAPQACTGGREFNSWYGHGEINLLKALSRGEGDN
jgi:lantibiotic leader peptide-processing serine protease